MDERLRREGPVELERQRAEAALRARTQEQLAREHARQRDKEARIALDEVEGLEREVAELYTKVGSAADAVAAAQNDAERAAASARLEELRAHKAAMEQRIAEAKAKAARGQRLKGVATSAECQTNPLAEGCQ